MRKRPRRLHGGPGSFFNGCNRGPALRHGAGICRADILRPGVRCSDIRCADIRCPDIRCADVPLRVFFRRGNASI